MATSTENASPIGIANVSDDTPLLINRKMYKPLLTQLVSLAPQPAVCQCNLLYRTRWQWFEFLLTEIHSHKIVAKRGAAFTIMVRL